MAEERPTFKTKVPSLVEGLTEFMNTQLERCGNLLEFPDFCLDSGAAVFKLEFSIGEKYYSTTFTTLAEAIHYRKEIKKNFNLVSIIYKIGVCFHIHEHQDEESNPPDPNGTGPAA